MENKELYSRSRGKKRILFKVLILIILFLVMFLLTVFDRTKNEKTDIELLWKNKFPDKQNHNIVIYCSPIGYYVEAKKNNNSISERLVVDSNNLPTECTNKIK